MWMNLIIIHDKNERSMSNIMLAIQFFRFTRAEVSVAKL